MWRSYDAMMYDDRDMCDHELVSRPDVVQRAEEMYKRKTMISNSRFV